MHEQFEEAMAEYKEAFHEHVMASKRETLAKSEKRAAHYRMNKAREELRAIERELMTEDSE